MSSQKKIGSEEGIDCGGGRLRSLSPHPEPIVLTAQLMRYNSF